MKSLKMIFVTLALAALLLGACVAPPAATTSAPVASPAASADTEAAAGPSASSALTTTIPSTTTLVPLKDAVATMDPQDVWQNFYELTQIPRPSHHEEQVRDFLVQFGQDLGLETIVDDVGNVLIRKPAAPGLENLEGVILQAHMDMVPHCWSGF